jgi:hypothetical protein
MKMTDLARYDGQLVFNHSPKKIYFLDNEVQYIAEYKKKYPGLK